MESERDDTDRKQSQSGHPCDRCGNRPAVHQEPTGDGWNLLVCDECKRPPAGPAVGQ